MSLRNIAIICTMPTTVDLKRGMEIATTFEDRHGHHPPMYFGTITALNAIVIRVMTQKTDAELKKCLKGLGIVTIKTVQNPGSIDRILCHLYRAAVHLSEVKHAEVNDAVHELYRMIGYDDHQEVCSHVCLANTLLARNLAFPNA